MKSAALRKELEPLAGPLILTERAAPEVMPTGISEVDSITGGLPRGCLTEILGPVSSGRTSVMLSILASATASGEVCAVVDAGDALDPASAAAAGIDLARLLWIRCGGNAEHALKATDLLVQGGGFGLVVMDFGDVAPKTARRISLTSWFRLRRAVEHTPTALVAVEQEANAKSCASLILESRREGALWRGALFRGFRVKVERRKPVHANIASFEAMALG